LCCPHAARDTRWPNAFPTRRSSDLHLLKGYYFHLLTLSNKNLSIQDNKKSNHLNLPLMLIKESFYILLKLNLCLLFNHLKFFKYFLKMTIFFLGLDNVLHSHHCLSDVQNKKDNH